MNLRKSSSSESMKKNSNDEEANRPKVARSNVMAPNNQSHKPVLPRNTAKTDGNAAKNATYIEIKWNKAYKKGADCGTPQLLYLLQVSMIKCSGRTKTNGGRSRSNADAKDDNSRQRRQVITNFLVWINEDRYNNVFNGKLLCSVHARHIVDDYLVKIGRLRKNSAKTIYVALKNEMINTTKWTRKSTLKLETWGWTKLYTGKILEECTTEEIVRVLMYKRDDQDDEQKQRDKQKVVIKGVFQIMEENYAKNRGNSLLINIHKFGDGVNGPLGISQQIIAIWKSENPDKDINDYWKHRVIDWLCGKDPILPADHAEHEAKTDEVGGPITGDMIYGDDAIPLKKLTSGLMNYFVPIEVLEQNKTIYNKFAHAVCEIFTELQRCNVHRVLASAAMQAKVKHITNEFEAEWKLNSDGIMDYRTNWCDLQIVQAIQVEEGQYETWRMYGNEMFDEFATKELIKDRSAAFAIKVNENNEERLDVIKLAEIDRVPLGMGFKDILKDPSLVMDGFLHKHCEKQMEKLISSDMRNIMLKFVGPFIFKPANIYPNLHVVDRLHYELTEKRNKSISAHQTQFVPTKGFIILPKDVIAFNTNDNDNDN